MIRKFRKKPVEIEAVQWLGCNDKNQETCTAIVAWIESFGGSSWIQGDFLGIRTLEGDMQANPGDWIIKGISGEFYPCKSGIFTDSYEPTDYISCS